MKCKHCGNTNLEGALYCGHCGKPLETNTDGNISNWASTQKGPSEPKGNPSWVEALNGYVGNTSPANLNWKVLFTDVFKSHTAEEAETIFICGTKTTTPLPSEVSKDWPRPWLYSRVLLMFLLAFVLLWICVAGFGNFNAMPGMIVVGSVAVPLSTMILFMELNVWRNVSMYRILQTFLVGGCASLAATLLLYSIYSVEEMSFAGAFAIGIIEEIGKAIIVFVFLRRLGKLSVLTGLLVGASVGAGFAAFESAGYALQPLMLFLQRSGFAAAYGQTLDEQQLMLDAIQQNIFVRGILAPGGHVAWAAISGAGLVIAAKEKGVFDLGLFAEKKYLRLFVIPVILHGLWDSPLSEWLNSLLPYVGYIALLILVWIVVFILINMGLGEVSQEVSKGSIKNERHENVPNLS